eukprot:CAMPEP_0198693124 /NCGR_PEP_ID=MMETSP1468-20131203/243989_1 /TAXON_ID=1461545 /ORGANISM="Mantoniella sp, Strain CCMP1436" /LENGTH=232 /DNA_ID=CAMNT_0044447571 /DNA_START=59 /DNA_END=755 /DNA_ORIENTATION=+
MSQGKAVIVVLVVGVTAAVGATGLYPIFIAQKKVPDAGRIDDGPVVAPGGFKRKSMWGNADTAIKRNIRDEKRRRSISRVEAQKSRAGVRAASPPSRGHQGPHSDTPRTDRGGNVHVGIDRGGEVATSARTTRRSALTSAAATWASLRGLIDDAATAAAAAAAAAPSTRATTSAVVAAGTTLGTLARPRAASARALVVVRSEPIAASAGEITLSIRMPPGYHFTKGANSRYE